MTPPDSLLSLDRLRTFGSFEDARGAEKTAQQHLHHVDDAMLLPLSFLPPLSSSFATDDASIATKITRGHQMRQAGARHDATMSSASRMIRA